MKKSNLILVSFVISLSFLLNSCGAIVKGTALKRFTVENKVIPADFGKKDEVLLCVLKGRDSRDKYMKKHISKYYKGQYEFVLQSDLSDAKYDDLSTYKYVFDYNALSSQGNYYNNASGSFENRTIPSSRYYIYDREANQYYLSNLTSGFFSKLIQAYVIKLEKVRLSNQ